MPRRSELDGIVLAKLAAAVENGRPTAELVEVAHGRRDLLAVALARVERGSEMRAPVAEHVERLRAAMELVSPH